MPAIYPTISPMNTTNVDPAELAKFSELAHRWWDVNSEFRPLHQINPLRLDWIQGLAPLKGKQVLDVGCGYHPFKGRINNIVGIDPYNNCADYEVDILDYKVKPKSHDVIIALGSINFNSRSDIEQRFSHCVDLLKSGGKFYLRANPGITHKTGPYVEIFPWTFEVVNEFAETHNLRLDTFKRDANDRLYFVYTKL